MEKHKKDTNPLAVVPIQKLILTFAIPAIISVLVGALYNMVDQIFIGRGVGVNGIAATNVSFPLTTIFIAISLLIGIGTASNFNLLLGKGNKEKAKIHISTGIILMLVSGIVISLLIYFNLDFLLKIFGTTEEIMPYAKTYSAITCAGFPFLVFNTASSHIIRADGSPNFAMFCVIVGAVINTVLDPLFIFTFNWGIAGAAWATVIGQIISALISMYYFVFKYKTFNLTKNIMKFHLDAFKNILALGASASFNQIALLIMQITLNNVLSKYGESSIYGSVIPLAVVGIVSKVNFIFLSICIGIGQGCQPIFGYNYGAENYKRVENTLKLTIKTNLIIGFIGFLSFQIFPKQIISFFGDGNDLYYEFGIKYFRIYMFFTITNGLMPLFGGFFAAIGKPIKGILMTLTRQFLFLVPLLLILPYIFGIDGIMFAGPIADFAALVMAVFLVTNEFKEMKKLEKNKINKFQ